MFVQKYYAQHGVLSDVRNFLEQQKPFLIHIEMVDENPDCNETMAQITEDLLDRSSSGAQHGWIVLVGDGKNV